MRNNFALIFFLQFNFLGIWAQVAVDTFDYKEILNLSYLSPKEVVVDSLQRLNLVLPTGVKNPPLLIWIGGGAWSFVDRHVEMKFARKMAREGIAVASVGHQLSKGSFSSKAKEDGIKHPAHIKDVAAAFKWLLDHAQQYGYDQNNIFVSGFSSGGHLAALLGMDKTYLTAHGLGFEHVKGIIPVAGAYDINHYYSVFLNHNDPEVQKMANTHVKDVFGDTEEDFRAASPTTYLDNLELPMLLISEGGLFNYTKVFEEKIWASQYRKCQIFHVLNLDHAGLWNDISNTEDSQTRKVMVDFVKRQARSGS